MHPRLVLLQALVARGFKPMVIAGPQKGLTAVFSTAHSPDVEVAMHQENAQPMNLSRKSNVCNKYCKRRTRGNDSCFNAIPGLEANMETGGRRIKKKNPDKNGEKTI
ncbi:hypothetical protein CHS0354_011304 [Potamilus streckersoni]|uniref:Uncharacterized protein n=1 Tax=Potamilus streckersoni TaxID=2493646 RepID=A0AAE0S8K5_9BIVA|nr:hypothetical protein CHS0354_011304 [Potamilus streckersoni]